mmetsp:Transcript_37315/g.89982  ORF Transcript_37315/g.89982 Transcript_37315/m.89982 type:complete len:205 (-) Transcript_37315:830-1444(-)
MLLLKRSGNVVTFFRFLERDRDRVRTFILAVVKLSTERCLEEPDMGADCADPTETLSESIPLRSIPCATEFAPEPPFDMDLFLLSRKALSALPPLLLLRPLPFLGALGSSRFLILLTYVPHWLVGNALVLPRTFTLNRIVGLSPPYVRSLTTAYVQLPSDLRTNAPSPDRISATAAAVAFLDSMIMSSSSPLSPIQYFDRVSGV